MDQNDAYTVWKHSCGRPSYPLTKRRAMSVMIMTNLSCSSGWRVWKTGWQTQLNLIPLNQIPFWYSSSNDPLQSLICSGLSSCTLSQLWQPSWPESHYLPFFWFSYIIMHWIFGLYIYSHCPFSAFLWLDLTNTCTHILVWEASSLSLFLMRERVRCSTMLLFASAAGKAVQCVLLNFIWLWLVYRRIQMSKHTHTPLMFAHTHTVTTVYLPAHCI